MVRQHHQLNRHESEQTPGDSGGQRRLACCMQSMGLQRVGHDLVTEQQQEQIYRPYSILTTCPTNGPHGKRKKKLWFKIQFRMLYFIQLSGHFSFLQSGKFYIYMYIYIYISLSFLTWTLRKKKKGHPSHMGILQATCTSYQLDTNLGASVPRFGFGTSLE